MKTLAGITIEVFPGVYPGGTDSELLAESINVKKGKNVLDLCTGNGIVAFAALQKGASKVAGTDLNPFAIRNANRNKHILKAKNAEFIEANLFPSNDGLYDLVTMNPPYTDYKAPDRVAICFWDETIEH